MINWKVRAKNKQFWISIIPALILLIKQICMLFGADLELDGISDKIIQIIETGFIILSLLGIVNDPTTESIYDSKLALSYTNPKKRIV